MPVKLSGFADEISDNFVKQLEGLKANEIEYIEVRGVNGKNISVLNQEELDEVKKLLEQYNIKVSSIGSPVGKVRITDDFGEHLEVFDSVLNAALTLETKYIRIFSFYVPANYHLKYRDDVLYRLETLADKAAQKNLILCLENERDLYGESPEKCLDLMTHFNGALKFIFDPANFIVGGFIPYPDAYSMLSEYIEYMHIKDADDTGIVPAGQGTGKIKEILYDLILRRNFENFLSIEPHLSVFTGLDKLGVGENKFVKNKFNTKEEAFAAASNALKKILKEINAKQ